MILADYEDKCPGCGEMIVRGSDIGLVDDEWVCVNCVDEARGEDGDG